MFLLVGNIVGRDAFVGNIVGKDAFVGRMIGRDAFVGKMVGKDAFVGKIVNRDASVGKSDSSKTLPSSFSCCARPRPARKAIGKMASMINVGMRVCDQRQM